MGRELLAAWLAYLSGVMLIISGTTGLDFWQKIQDQTLELLNFEPLKQIFFIIIIVASLGGLSVMAGGFLITKHLVFPGRMMIWIGSGVGLISMGINIFTSIVHDGFSLGGIFSLAPIGILLAFLAQLLARYS